MIIREPRMAEAPACRMLLPETHLDPVARCFRLALDDDGSILGALSYRDEGASLGGLRVHVTEPHRRSGIASRLFDRCESDARQLSRPKIIAWADIHTEPSATPFLNSRGFQVVSRLTVIEGSFEQLRASWLAARSKLPSCAPLPPEARFVDISEAPLQQLAELHARHITHMPVVPGLQRMLKLDRYSESVILMFGDRIAGAILGEITDGVLSVPAWIVAPEHRGKQLGGLMRVALLDRVMNRVERIRFEYLEQATATEKLSREAGYTTLRILAQFEKSLSGVDSVSTA